MTHKQTILKQQNAKVASGSVIIPKQSIIVACHDKNTQKGGCYLPEGRDYQIVSLIASLWFYTPYSRPVIPFLKSACCHISNHED